MNEIVRPPMMRQSTQAAEGLPRWRWTVAEIDRVAAAGLFTENDRFELIGGEIVPMSPKGLRHERLRTLLNDMWSRMAPMDVVVTGEPQFNIDVDTYVNPDILVHTRSIFVDKVRGPEALLVVEVAETSLSYDIKTKLPIYASHGVPEYWVINAATLQTTIHLEPVGQAYSIEVEFSSDKILVPSLVPALAIALNTLVLN